jgi:hypothetical protein
MRNDPMVRNTRFDGLGYVPPSCNGDAWRFVDMTDPQRNALVGPHYRTKAELLADLERYAKEYGF